MRICRYLWLFVGLIFSTSALSDFVEPVRIASCWTSIANYDYSCAPIKKTCSDFPSVQSCYSKEYVWGSQKGFSVSHCPSSLPFFAGGFDDESGKMDCYSVCPAGTEPDGSGKCVAPPKDCPMFGTPQGDAAPIEQPEGCTCPAGTVWVSMNGCRKECGSWKSGEKVAGFGTVYGPGQKIGCSQGCEIQPSVEGFEYPDGSFLGISDTYTGWACPGTGPGSGGNNPVKDNPTPKEPPKEPPCPTGYGVLTSTSGSVGCVPPGEPDKKIPDGRKPVVEKTVKKETYPDGSEKTTKTTKTKDPGTGATNTSSTTTSTGGMAGPAGTTTGTETKTGGGKGTGTGSGGDGEGDCEGEDCSGEGFDGPDGDLYEKKNRTMRDALEDFSAAVSDAPAMVAARNWFSIGGMPAGCGGLSVTVPYLDTTISADSIFCGEYGALIMQIAGAVVLAAAAYAGFRIAIL